MDGLVHFVAIFAGFRDGFYGAEFELEFLDENLEISPGDGDDISVIAVKQGQLQLVGRVFEGDVAVREIVVDAVVGVKCVEVVRDHIAAGTRPTDLVRELKMQPFRAQKLADQAGVWSPGELDDALEGLLDLDLASKGISLDGDPRAMSDARSGLRLQVWLAVAVARKG